MRLMEVVRHLQTKHDAVVDYPLSDGEHLVSPATALALSNLVQCVAVHGLEATLDERQDLWVAVVSALLPQSHPGWSQKPGEQEEAETIDVPGGLEPLRESTIASPMPKYVDVP